MSALPGPKDPAVPPSEGGSAPVARVALPDEIWARYAAVPRRVKHGHRVVLLRDGRATFPEMLAAIQRARQHVNLASYMFRSDTTGQIFAEALSAKAREGVQVNLIFDAIGSADADYGLFDRMRQAGVQVVEYHPLRPWRPRWGWWRRDHRKILVIDGELGFTGGVNIADVFAPAETGGGGWRDTHLKIEGPAVSDLQRSFIAVWRRAGGKRLEKKAYLPRLASVGVTPARVVGNTLIWNRWAIRKSVLAAFRAARRSIWVANAYFIPDGPILGELLRARGRGVDVRLMLPRKSDVPIVALASRRLYQLLLDEGVRIFEWEGPMLHAKTMVVDGIWSAVGSFNLDRMSLVNNLEISVNLFDPVVGAELEKMFEEDLAGCAEIKADRWRVRPWKEKAVEWMASLLSPWL